MIENLSFEKVENFKYLGVMFTKANNIRGAIERRINMGNECYYSLIVQPAFQITKLIHIKQLYYQLHYMVVKLSSRLEREAEVKGVRE